VLSIFSCRNNTDWVCSDAASESWHESNESHH